MTFIPEGIKVGDRVRITKDMEVLAGKFTVGHEFKVIAYGVRGLDLEDDKGNRLLETGLSSEFIEKIEDKKISEVKNESH